MPEGLFDFTINTSSLSSIVCTIGWKTGWRGDFKIDVLCKFQQGDIVPFLRVRFVLGRLWMEERVDLQLYFLPGGEVDHHVQEDCTNLPVLVGGVVSAADVEDAKHYVKVVFGVFHKLTLIDVISPM